MKKSDNTPSKAQQHARLFVVLAGIIAATICSFTLLTEVRTTQSLVKASATGEFTGSSFDFFSNKIDLRVGLPVWPF